MGVNFARYKGWVLKIIKNVLRNLWLALKNTSENQSRRRRSDCISGCITYAKHEPCVCAESGTEDIG